MDSTYKTVGLLVAAAFAYLLKPEAAPPLILVGLALYAAYIVFVLFYYVGAIARDYASKEATFARQRTEIE